MDELEFDSPPKRRTNMIIVIGVVGVAFVAVMAMRFLSPRDADAGDPGIDQQIDEILEREKKNPLSPDAIKNALPEPPVKAEVNTPRNPFPVDPDRPRPRPADPKEARRAEILEAAGRLRLGAIMTGRNPVASVNGRGVRVGGVIEIPAEDGRARIVYRVTSITKTAVNLVVEEPDLDLTVDTALTLNRP
jgi:type IV secretory pathway VirB10-like protein